MTLKPIKKKRLFEEIVLAIEKYIEEENIQSGERLPSESELAKLFDVSKTAVREAMSVLHANGIIETQPGSGIYLKNINGTIVQRIANNLMSNTDIQEILDFRRGIEVEAAALAASRSTKKDLEAIKLAHQKLVEANQSGLIGVKEDYLFHYRIILAAHNSIYKDIFDSIADKFEIVVRISKMQSAKLPGRFEESYKEHKRIIEAIAFKNPQLASEAMRHHLMRNEKKIWLHLNDES